MRELIWLAAGLIALPLAAQAKDNDSCLRFGRIYSWRAPDNRTLIVEDDLYNKFKVDLLGICIGLTDKLDIAFTTSVGNQLSCVSRGDSVVYRKGGLGEQRCTVKSVVPYTAAMEAADKAASSETSTSHAQ